MNSPTWTIVRKDFRLTRLFLLAWWGILAAGAIITVWNLNQIMLDPFSFYYDYAPRDFVMYTGGSIQETWPYFSILVVLAVDAILLAVIVDLIIKADSPIDEKAVWHTRPVSGLGVWRAKLLYLGLFCFLVPGTIQTLERLYLRMDAADCLHGFVHFAIIQAILVAIIATASVLFQRTFSGLLVFCVIAVIIFLGVQYDFFSGTVVNQTLSSADGQINAQVVFSGLAVVGLVVTALMYAWRNRTVGWVTLGGCVLATMLACIAWQKYPHGSPGGEPQRDDRVQMGFNNHPIGSIDPFYNHPDQVRLQPFPTIQLRGTPGTVLHITNAYSRLSWPGTKLPAVEIHQHWGAWGPLFINIANAVAAAGYGIPKVDNGVTYPDIELERTKEQLAQNAALPARWTSTVTGEIGHLEVEGDVPLADDTQWAHNESLFEADVWYPRQPGELRLILWEASPTYFSWTAPPPPDDGTHIILLYNPAKKETIMGQVEFSDRNRENLSVYFIANHTAKFYLSEIPSHNHPMTVDGDTLRTLERNGDPTAVQVYMKTLQRDYMKLHHQEISDWLAGARLVELHFVSDRIVYNTVTVDLPQIITPDVAKAAGLPTP